MTCNRDYRLVVADETWPRSFGGVTHTTGCTPITRVAIPGWRLSWHRSSRRCR